MRERGAEEPERPRQVDVEVVCQVSSSSSASGTRRAMPAFATAMSTRPSSAAQRATSASTCRRGDVDLGDERAPAGLLDAAAHRLDVVRIAGTTRARRPRRPCEHARGGRADPRRGAGDDGDASVKPEHPSTLPCHGLAGAGARSAAAVVEQRIAARVGAVAEPVDEPEVEFGDEQCVLVGERDDGVAERVDDAARAVEPERADVAALVHAHQVGDVLDRARRCHLSSTKLRRTSHAIGTSSTRAPCSASIRAGSGNARS